MTRAIIADKRIDLVDDGSQIGERLLMMLSASDQHHSSDWRGKQDIGRIGDDLPPRGVDTVTQWPPLRSLFAFARKLFTGKATFVPADALKLFGEFDQFGIDDVGNLEQRSEILRTKTGRQASRSAAHDPRREWTSSNAQADSLPRPRLGLPTTAHDPRAQPSGPAKISHVLAPYT